jgi:cytidylate kinase
MINPKSFEATNAYLISELKRSGETEPKHIKHISNPFITISRQAGAGGTIVGEKLIDFLNTHKKTSIHFWTLFDKNLIKLVIEEHHMPEDFKHYIDETKFSELQSVFEQICGLHPSTSKLMTKTCRTILNLAAIGYVVLIGRGANILTRSLPGGFHVRLIADVDWRLRNLEKNNNLTRKEAIRFLETEDNNRREYVKKIFNKDVGDIFLYDLIINTGKVSFDKTVEIIGTHVLQYEDSILVKH